MTDINPLERLNLMVIKAVAGLPHARLLRKPVIALLAEWPNDRELKSTSDLPEDTVLELLERFYPGWRDPDAVPPASTDAVLRPIAERVSQQMLLVHGTPEQLRERNMAEQARLRAEREARQAEKRARYEERKRKERERRERKAKGV